MGSGQTVLTVIIPAHNEALVIEATLRSLFRQRLDGGYRVIVVPNGCTDQTAELCRAMQAQAERHGVALEVLEIGPGDKAEALNRADALAGPGVRVYLDADVELGPGALAAIVAALKGGGVALCAPRIRLAPARSFWTRCYGRVWQELPVVRHGVIGAGCYAVGQEARGRWTTFPPILADDKFVRLTFPATERRVLEDACFFVQMPEGLPELLTVRSRWCRGNHQLKALFPDLARRDTDRYRATIASWLRQPRLWPYLPMFVLVFALAEILAWGRRDRAAHIWERAIGARRVMSRAVPLTPS